MGMIPVDEQPEWSKGGKLMRIALNITAMEMLKKDEKPNQEELVALAKGFLALRSELLDTLEAHEVRKNKLLEILS